MGIQTRPGTVEMRAPAFNPEDQSRHEAENRLEETHLCHWRWPGHQQRPMQRQKLFSSAVLRVPMGAVTRAGGGSDATLA